MKETIKNSASFIRKNVLKKKYVVSLVVIFILITGIRFGYESLFEIEGVVQKVESNQVTVANFFVTQKVDLMLFEEQVEKLEVGDYIRIQKNLSGDVIGLYERGYDEGGYNDRDHDDRDRNEH